MANTQGLQDTEAELISSLITPDPDYNIRSESIHSKKGRDGNSKQKKKKSSSSFFQSRERMMEEFQNDGTMRPSAKVVRMKPHQTTPMNTKISEGRKGATSSGATARSVTFTEPEEKEKKDSAPSILLGIMERPVHSREKHSMPASIPQKMEDKKPRLSRFQQRQQEGKQQSHSMNRGFPSLDMPLGTFTKKSISEPLSENFAPSSKTPSSIDNEQKENGGDIVSNMSAMQIQESLSEIESMLSPKSISFLKQRGMQKKKKSLDRNVPIPEDTTVAAPVIKTDPLEEKKVSLDRLSSIQTVDDLESLYKESNPELQPYNSCPEIDPDPSFTVDTLEGITHLLRSAVPRQRFLAVKSLRNKLHQNALQQQNELIATAGSPPFPPMLPISLRCVLDDLPLKNLELYGLKMSHTLQSLYYLCCLVCEPAGYDRITNDDATSNNQCDASFIYWNRFMGIDFPSKPPQRVVAVPLEEKKNPLPKPPNGEETTAGYATEASSQSATSDSVAFLRDPIWTLMTKMRIIPALLIFLKKTNRAARMAEREVILDDDTVLSILGILGLLGRRSPGAATLIGRHPVIVGWIVDHCFPSPDDRTAASPGGAFIVPTRKAYGALRFLCVLAQQSRGALLGESPVTAPDNDTDNGNPDDLLISQVLTCVQPVLGIRAECEEETNVQKMSLILWRILSRYGLFQSKNRKPLHESFLQTLLTCSVRHLCTFQSTPLTPFYLEAFSEIMASLQEESDLRSGFHTAILSSFVPFARSCHLFLNSTQTCEEDTDLCIVQNVQIMASRLRFLRTYCFLSAKHNDDAATVKTHPSEPPFYCTTQSDLISTLQSAANGPIMEYALNAIVSCAQERDNCNDVNNGSKSDSNRDWEREASSSALLREFCICCFFCVRLQQQRAGEKDAASLNNPLTDLLSRFADMVLKAFTLVDFGGGRDNQKGQDRSCSGSPAVATHVTVARRRWWNVSLFWLAKVLLLQNSIALSLTTATADSSFPLIRSICLDLLGRLQVGEEALAFSLLQDSLFFSSDSGSDGSNTVSGGARIDPISAMLLRELSSESNLPQLIHSIRLFPDISWFLNDQNNNPMNFDVYANLNSLRVDADAVPGGGTAQEEDGFHSKLLLPLGEEWIWHILSSTFREASPERKRQGKNVRASLCEEGAAVVSCCLNLICQMEEVDESTTSEYYRSYSKRFPTGVKLYHIMNVCLFPEEILREVDELLLIRLLKRYTGISSSSAVMLGEDGEAGHQLATCFVSSCYRHSRRNSPQGNSTSEIEFKSEDRVSEEDRKKVEEILSLVLEEHNPLGEFIQDICAAFLQYGAQYDSFMFVIVFFLRPMFPFKVITKIITQLGEVLHLANNTLIKDGVEEKNDHTCVLSLGLSGGLPSKDGSKRDPPEILDALAISLKAFAPLSRSSRGSNDNHDLRRNYIYSLAVAHLGRNLASAVQLCNCGLEAMKRRLEHVDLQTVVRVTLVARGLIRSEKGDVHDLVGVVWNVLTFQEEEGLDLFMCVEDAPFDIKWGKVLDTLSV